MIKKSPCILFIIICVAFFLRASMFVFFAQEGRVETYEYESAATNLLNGTGLSFWRFGTIYRSGIAPVYPFLCAVTYFIFGNNIAFTVLMQIIISLLLCIVIFCIGKKIFNENIGLLAAALAAFHPGLLIYSSVKLHALILNSFLMCLTVLLVIYVYERPTLIRQLVLGIVFGITILQRPTFLLFLLASFFWLYYYLKEKALAFKVLLRVSLIVAIILAPWFLRNYKIHKEIVLFQNNQWEGLWVGYNPNASGTLYLSSGEAIVDASPPEFRKELFSLDELGQGSLFRKEALRFIRQNPLEALKLTVKRFLYFWWFFPQTGLLYPQLWVKLYKIYYIIILLLSFIGLGLLIKEKLLRKFAFLIVLAFLSIDLAQSFYYVELRHRWSLEPLLLILTAAGMLYLIDNYNIFKIRSQR